jgi:A/G-specific adenine glycosylase
MELGQTLCTPNRPQCHICPWQSLCIAYLRESQGLAPKKKVRGKPAKIKLKLVIPQSGHRLGLLQRSSSARFLKGIDGFPTLICHDDLPHQPPLLDGSEKCQKLQKALQSLVRSQVGKVSHAITKYRIEADVEVAEIEAGSLLSKELAFFPIDQLEARLTSNLDRKALRVFRGS